MTEIYFPYTKEIRIYSPVKTKLYVYTIFNNTVDICMNDIEEGLNIVCCCNSRIFGPKATIAITDSWIYELKRGHTLQPSDTSDFVLSFFIQPKHNPTTLFYAALYAMNNSTFNWGGGCDYLKAIGFVGTKTQLSGYDKHGEEIFFCTCQN